MSTHTCDETNSYRDANSCAHCLNSLRCIQQALGLANNITKGGNYINLQSSFKGLHVTPKKKRTWVSCLRAKNAATANYATTDRI
jgi:hypothetical protein